MTRPRKVKTRSVGYRVSRRGVKKHENLLRCPRFGSGFELSMCVRGICVWRELGPLCCRLIAPPGGGKTSGVARLWQDSGDGRSAAQGQWRWPITRSMAWLEGGGVAEGSEEGFVGDGGGVGGGGLAAGPKRCGKVAADGIIIKKKKKAPSKIFGFWTPP